MLHYYQDNDLNNLQIKKSKYIILSVILKSKKDLFFSFSFNCIENFHVKLFVQSQAVNISLKLVQIIEFESCFSLLYFNLLLHLSEFFFH